MEHSKAWSEPAAGDWPRPPRPRPLLIWQPELVHAPERPEVPERFRWRGRNWEPAAAEGPERIAPEWWLEDPNWRSGVRDYWRVETREGARLWLFHTPQSPAWPAQSWFAQGEFA